MIQVDVLELKNTITKTSNKSSVNGPKRRRDGTEARLGGLGSRRTGMT